MCVMEVASRALVRPGEPLTLPDLESPSAEELDMPCYQEISRGETPGREDCRIDPPDGEVAPDSNKSNDKKGLGKCQGGLEASILYKMSEITFVHSCSSCLQGKRFCY